MNLYLVSQRDNRGCDTYDSCVVVASSEEEARNIHPGNETDRNCWQFDLVSDTSKITVVFLGVYAGPSNDLDNPVICSSFHAG